MLWKEFRTFIARGNIVELAVAVILGGALGTIVKSLVDDIIMPLAGLALGKMDFTNLFVVLRDGVKAPPPYATLADARAAGAVTLNWGLFINAIIAFLIVALVVFFILRWLQKISRQPAPDLRPCAFCAMPIPLAARRCPHCTSELSL